MYNPILDLIILLAGLTSIVGSLVTMKKVKANLQPEQDLQESLTDDEKKKVYSLAILNPIWTGIIFYFGWKKVLPIKAKNANKITFIAFGLWLLSSILFNWPINLSV